MAVHVKKMFENLAIELVNEVTDKVAIAADTTDPIATPSKTERLPWIITNTFSSPNVSPAFSKFIYWPEETKDEKGRQKPKFAGVPFPHAVTGNDMRQYYNRRKNLKGSFRKRR